MGDVRLWYYMLCYDNRYYLSNLNWKSNRIFIIAGYELHIVSADTTKVCISNIPPTATNKKLIHLFKFAGWITNVNIGHCNSNALVFFQDIQSATNLLNCEREFVLDGYQLSIQRRIYDESTVYIRNVPAPASKKEIEGLFRNFGIVNKVSIIKKPGNTYAFVEFETENSAAAAIECSTKTQFRLHGNTLELEFKRYWTRYK